MTAARTGAARGLALRWHLVLLVVGALLPLLVFAAVVVYRLAGSERAAADRRLIRSAHDLSLALDREIKSTVRTLSALAESDELDRGSLEEFHAEAQRIVARQSVWLTLILLRPDGQQVVNTDVPWGTPLPAAVDQDSLARAVERKGPVVGALKRGRMRPTLGFPVRVPVMRGGEVRYVLTAVITPDALASLVGLRGSPDKEWTRAVVDTEGFVVARSREPERFVGRRLPEESFRRLREFDEGLFRDTSLDGRPVYVAFSREAFSGWTTAVVVPVEVLDSPARATTAAVLALGLALLSLSTGGAYVLARRISRGLMSATEAAEDLARGRPPRVRTSAVREVTQLGEALAHSAALLSQRERERNEHLEHADAARAEAESARRAQEGLLRGLRESEARLRLVTDHAPVLITYCGADRTYKFVNRPYAERFGLSPEEVVGRHFREVMGRDAYAAIEPYVDAVLRGERFEFESEVPYSGIGTRHVWVAYEPEFDGAGRVTGFVGAILDITERRRAEVALRESDERFARAFEASPLALTISSLKTGRLLEVNETFTGMSGYAREEALGRTTVELGLWAEPSERDAGLAALARGGRVRNVECRFSVRDGTGRTGLVSAERIEVGGEPCVLTVIQDITEQKRAEAERERLLAREKSLRAAAEDANRLKDEFLATVSHELRTPLTAILGWAQMLEGDALDGDTARHAVTVIRRNANQQRQIVEDILDVSRIITGKLRLESEPVEMVPTVQSAIDSVRPAAEARGIQLRYDFAPDVVVTGDPHRLQQVVWNLLSKPVEPEALVAAVVNLAGRAAPRES